jgi:hypothetical protein
VKRTATALDCFFVVIAGRASKIHGDAANASLVIAGLDPAIDADAPSAFLVIAGLDQAIHADTHGASQSLR